MKKLSKFFLGLLLYSLTINNSVFSHTDTIGYTNAGSGAMTFWFGNWHVGTNFNEGSINLAPISGSSYPSTTVAFNLLTNIFPAGLINGVNYFTSNGVALVAKNGGNVVSTWQGATFNGLTSGTYRFTYIPIANPTQDWVPKDAIILSSTFTIDALFLGFPAVADTQMSMANTASVLQGAFTLQNSVMVNSFSYDCSVFQKHGICVSAGGRNTMVQAQGINNTSSLLIASHRLDENNSRIGAYADQNLSVSGPGAIRLSNSTPMLGIFGVWSERPDGIGTEVKVSAAYGQKSATVTRQVVGTSEAGIGGSNLTTQGAQALVKYGFEVAKDIVVSPYAGIRYTQNNMGGYTEASSGSVTSPLTYSVLDTNATTALIGAEAKYKGLEKTTLVAGIGLETDTKTANGSYFGSNSNIAGLTPINFNANPVKTRPTAALGAYYDIAKNQRLGITGIYRQEPFQSVSTTAVMATYTVGF